MDPNQERLQEIAKQALEIVDTHGRDPTPKTDDKTDHDSWKNCNGHCNGDGESSDED
jgi:hypothetical protein